jgi:hypothetical protein
VDDDIADDDNADDDDGIILVRFEITLLDVVEYRLLYNKINNIMSIGIVMVKYKFILI